MPLEDSLLNDDDSLADLEATADDEEVPVVDADYEPEDETGDDPDYDLANESVDESQVGEPPIGLTPDGPFSGVQS